MKGMDQKKTEKKKPEKSLKEKRAAKKDKKAASASGRPETEEGVYLVKGGKIEFQKVETGLAGELMIEVKKGPVVGQDIVTGPFKVLRQAESTDTFSLEEMVGSTGRVSVGIPANRFGTVLISYAGASHNMTATADAEIPAGRVVKVVAVNDCGFPINVLTTEHYNLQTQRAATISEANGRASVWGRSRLG